ncbi:MAG: hypothetical protein NTW87_03570 [Planctomycetota bacterium]|nr:hypothetical protein [Planctomycetota bacterium]
MVAAVLAILAAMATGFYTLMLMQTKSAVRYADTVRAEMMARAGIEYAIAHVREETYRRMEDTSAPWYTTDYTRGAVKRPSFPDSELLHNGSDDDNDGQVNNLEEAWGDPLKMKSYSVALSNSANADVTGEGGSDRFTLNVFDAASRININAGDNLAVLLDNLCRVIGPPLVAADPNAVLPRCWAPPGNGGAWGEVVGLFDNAYNVDDTKNNKDVYYWLKDTAGNPVWKKYGDPVNGRPTLNPDDSKTALFGDGYAIAGYRARNGRFGNIEEVKQALTYVERNNNLTPDDPMEQLEIEVKFAALRDYITIDSWVDTNTVCVGKFEWVTDPNKSGLFEIGIDRDKSWIPDDVAGDPYNRRGSLRGCYISIINGHGAGQVRRIKTNGVDWIQVETFKTPQGLMDGFTIPPGPISSYMIIPPENAQLVDVNGKDVPYSYPDNPPPPNNKQNHLFFPKTDAKGNFVPAIYSDGPLKGSPKIDYSLRPLCIHRAPVNINTASDKVLAALFMGINVQQGHHLAIGTEADLEGTRNKWKMADVHELESYLLTGQGLKRVPVVAGRPVLDRIWGSNASDPAQVVPPPSPEYDVAYINNNDTLGSPSYIVRKSKDGADCTMNEAHELAYRIIMVRQYDKNFPYINPWTGAPTNSKTYSFTDAKNAVTFKGSTLVRGPIKSWDDFYFRIVKPWDDKRVMDGWTDVNGTKAMDGWVDVNKNQFAEINEIDTYKNATRARMLMAHFNSNTDILKFNPNIEWIDRWGRNFSELEPIHIYPKGDSLPNTTPPIYVQYGRTADEGGSGERHWSGKYDWCPAVLEDFDSRKSGAYVTRGFRYKSDEMIDKTDMNRSTTEFCFDSGGIFEIHSTGRVERRGEMLAERKLQALVKVYDVWRESTQRQFTQGVIEVGPGVRIIGPPGSSHSGQIARDAKNGDKGSQSVLRLPLTTLPEPLVPVLYRITRPSKQSLGINAELVDVENGRGICRDAFGNERRNPYDKTAKSIEVPDVVANQIPPAGYDGQIVLATNTLQFDPDPDQTDSKSDRDSFLASFDGDLDTGTCLGNGREQAKVPGVPGTHDGYKYRVLDTTGLLGVLNDNLWDQDPMASNVPNTYMWGSKVGAYDANDTKLDGVTYPKSTASIVGEMLRGIDRNHYWEEAKIRQGDLRNDGVYLTSPGVGGNDATLKYTIGWTDESGTPHPASVTEDTLPPGNYPQPGVPPKGSSYWNRANFDIMQSFKGSQEGEGFLLTMWAKTSWKQNDNRSHEFFSAVNPGHYLSARGFVWYKAGRYAYANWGDGGGFSGCTRRKNDLYFGMEGEHRDILDRDNVVQLHGGTNRVRYSEPPQHTESPAYRVQPFRWMYMGIRLNYCQTKLTQPGQLGHWYRGGGRNSDLRKLINWLNRPFTSTEVYPEDAVYKWDGSPDDGSMWTNWINSDYYMYQCNTLINDSYFARAPDISRTYQVSGLPTFLQNGGNAWYAATDDKGNSRWSGTPFVDCSKGADYGGRTAQDVRWDWADHFENPQNTDGQIARVKNNAKVFSINNLCFGELLDSEPDLNTKETENSDGNACTKSAWIYRQMPEDGTYAVIDELKISKREKTMQTNDISVRKTDRVTGTGGGTAYGGKWMGGEIRTSRYYLPPDPHKAVNCPTFTSQTMLQSLKGTGQVGKGEAVCVARVTWTVFTPRFMSEYKYATKNGKFKRSEYYFEGDYSGGGQISSGNQLEHKDMPYNGPYDFERYNADIYNWDETVDRNAAKNRYYSVNRPTPTDYNGQAHATKGVEVEIGTLSGGKFTADNHATVVWYDGTGKLQGGDAVNMTTFTDPDTVNRLGSINVPVRIMSGELAYRVRFRYPVDQLVDRAGGLPDIPANSLDPRRRSTNSGHNTAEGDQTSQFLLDTPVFDDISITYFTKPRILSYREVLE